MFILRKINGLGIQSNKVIGTDYVLLRKGDGKEFEKTMELEPYFTSLKESIYAFVIFNDGHDVLPLYIDQQNYMMSSDGNTFANLTLK